MKHKQERVSLEDLLKLPVVMGIAEAANVFGIGESQMYKLARAGEFPCRVRPVGKRYKVTKADLMREFGLNMDGSPIIEAEPPAAGAA